MFLSLILNRPNALFCAIHALCDPVFDVCVRLRSILIFVFFRGAREGCFSTRLECDFGSVFGTPWETIFGVFLELVGRVVFILFLGSIFTLQRWLSLMDFGYFGMLFLG